MNKTYRINNDRLKEARLFRRMTMDELGQKVSINKQAISQFENSKAFPEPTTLRKISEALGFPYSFFIEEDYDSVLGNTYFRALYSSKKKDLVSQQIKTKYLAKIYSILLNSRKLKFMELNLPDLPKKPITINAIAEYTRKYWNLGNSPISDMVSLLERNGIVVSELSTECREIDAFYQYNEENGIPIHCVVLGTDKNSFYRRQFNCAHELGHILIHERYADLNEIDREEFRERENEANAFASAFLLPAESFGYDVSVYPNRLSHYVELKKKWNVSMMAMIMRAHQLNYISPNQYSYLMRQINTKGYRQHEPLDDSTPINRPRALKQAIKLLMNKLNMSGSDIMELFKENKFSISPDIVEELLNLEQGILSYSKDMSNNVLVFPVSGAL